MAPDTPPPESAASARLDAARAELDRAPGVVLAVVFGSAARGTSRRARDLDIGVLTGEGHELPPLLAVALERATGQVIDLVHLNTAPPLLRFEIARDGVVLVERRAHAWADFRMRAMVDWWDWAPLARRMHRAAAERLRAAATDPGR